MMHGQKNIKLNVRWFSYIHAKLRCTDNVEFLNTKPGGTWNNH